MERGSESGKKRQGEHDEDIGKERCWIEGEKRGKKYLCINVY